MQADDLIGALLTRVAAHPHYVSLVSQLTVRHGVELYLRSPAVFNIACGERGAGGEQRVLTPRTLRTSRPLRLKRRAAADHCMPVRLRVV